ncbi:OPT oligopeptide transporter protein-domain-containing protein [Myxozyma melibiosi]|uniref:OPT oligopeptide transporter protein-domain-containing protein n=1 Tax=Myxozyma melibiosi TaxID=54550 RepID=A0ABR1FFU7_9ASCO
MAWPSTRLSSAVSVSASRLNGYAIKCLSWTSSGCHLGDSVVEDLDAFKDLGSGHLHTATDKPSDSLDMQSAPLASRQAGTIAVPVDNISAGSQPAPEPLLSLRTDDDESSDSESSHTCPIAAGIKTSTRHQSDNSFGSLCGAYDLDLTMDDITEKKAPAVETTTAVDPTALNEKLETFEVNRERVIEHLDQSSDLNDILKSDVQLEFILDKMQYVSLEMALEILKEAEQYHQDDYNFPERTMKKIQNLISGVEASGLDYDTFELDARIEATLMKYYSPYPEVRAVVSPIDDPTAYVETLRAYFLGIIWSGVGSFIVEFFQPRQPSLSIGTPVLQILIYPCGKFLAQVLPDWGFTLFGTRYSLNPGPWSYKEQMFATIMVNCGGGFSNIINNTLVLSLDTYFGQKWADFGFMFLMNFSTSYFGFGMAGILRRVSVYSEKAVWPSIMPTLMLNRTLMLPEEKRSINGWTISKYKLLCILMVASFLYYFVPDYLFTALSTFNWMTWIAPNNVKLAIITGSSLGAGINPIPTFDWAVINYSTPLVTPFFSQMNFFVGTLFGGLLMIALYWRNYKYTGYMPINSSGLRANDGSRFNVSRVLTNNKFDLEKYKSYSPAYYTAGSLLRQGAAFCQYTLSFVFIFLSDWKILWQTFKGMVKNIKSSGKTRDIDDFDDPMSRMMRVYPEVPSWWYLAVLVASLVMGIICFEVYPINVGVWMIFVVFFISAALLIPSAVVFSVSGYQLVMNDLMAIIGGYMVPGVVGVMMARFYGYNNDEQAETFVSDLKLGHYAKLPPRAVFRGQMVSTMVNVLVTNGAVMALMKTVDGLCTPTQANKFVCPNEGSMFNSVTMFGAVGPDRVLNTLYPGLKYCFLVGALLGFIFYGLRTKFPKQLRYVHPVVMMSGINNFWGYGYNLSYIIPGVYFNWFFMNYIKSRYLAWWTKYNFIITSALTTGTAFSAIVIFGALDYTKTELNWWGNTVSSAGIDGTTTALYEIPEVGYFGLAPGEFS